jgi:hypothetical protein
METAFNFLARRATSLNKLSGASQVHIRASVSYGFAYAAVLLWPEVTAHDYDFEPTRRG